MKTQKPKATKHATAMSTYKGYAVGCGHFNGNNSGKLSYVVTMPNANSERKLGQVSSWM